MKLKQLRKSLAVLLVATILLSATAQADVDVIREGQESRPMGTVGKSTFYGTLTGMLIRGAIALAVDENSSDVLKRSFVAGTSAGPARGIYHVNTRPEPSSVTFSLGSDGSATMALPKPRLRLSEDGTLGVETKWRT